MHERLMEVLVEPGTSAPLRLSVSRGKADRIEEGELTSELSGKRYPIVRGIPRFVPAENYAHTFGFQWNRFRATQIDSETLASISRKRFDAEAGWSREELAGRWVLDAGCGAGRFAEIAAERDARVVALDLSSAVDATAQTVARFDNVDVVQGNLLAPPFRKGAFDFGYSIGVIQHTPDRERAVRSFVSCVRTGGAFALTIYARRPWTKLNAKYLVRPLTRRVPEAQLVRWIERAMPYVFPITDVLFRLPLLGQVSRFVVPVANYVERDEFTRQQRYDEALLDTFDMLSPRYDEPMTPREVERALRKEAVAQWRFRTRRPISLTGIR